ncbi:MAG: diaminopimelate decarboxylase [Acidobacteria bacterium]|nr:diaminopimelate decarboxylase [Acidobacteriota bacterium]
MASPWWARNGLEIRQGRLIMAGQELEHLAREHGTPLYVYDTARMEANARRLAKALESAGLRHRVLLALKSQRHPAVLKRLRAAGVGIDACSPNEVSLALESGWNAGEISFTGTCLSPRDWDRILAHPIQLNLDSLSAIRQLGERLPGRTIGLRLNPRAGVGYSEKQTYSGDRPTKFGIYPNQLQRALDLARDHDLRVNGLHFHLGSGWLRGDLSRFLEIVQRLAGVASEIRGLEYVNVGGGIGVPIQESEEAVDLDAYARGLAEHLGPLGVTIICEPGDFVVRDAGVLLAEVVCIDEKGGETFAGVDCGWNVWCGTFIYHYPQEVVLCRAPTGEASRKYTIAGHINEASDLFAEGVLLPEVREGDVLALLNTGGYGANMSSLHCSRPHAGEIAL